MGLASASIYLFLNLLSSHKIIIPLLGLLIGPLSGPGSFFSMILKTPALIAKNMSELSKKDSTSNIINIIYYFSAGALPSIFTERFWYISLFWTISVIIAYLLAFLTIIWALIALHH
ncbi:MAG: hypothetical protein P4L50_04400 [Anaerolineaceae bacterium]|nr:hypothetical protein [Anaerolineaceae bacterium]